MHKDNTAQEQRRIGMLIAQRRKELRMTQAKLAKLLSTSQSAVARMEGGEQNFSTEMLAKVGSMLQTNLAGLLTGESSFEIQGGKKLYGTVEIRGAKNSALKILAATILYQKPVTITNLPLIEDVFRMIELLEHLGAHVVWRGYRSIEVNTAHVRGEELQPEISKRFRGSIVLVGPLLARFGHVRFPHPGGCVIGERPIDLFLAGWKRLGARISEHNGFYDVTLKNQQSSAYMFRHISVTGTETLMLQAVIGRGRLILENAAMEPEIPHLAQFLNQSGASITGAGTHTIEILGTGGKLLDARASFVVMPDRIEAASFLILGALLGKKVTILDCKPSHLRSLIEILRESGVDIQETENSIVVQKPKNLRAISVKTHEYPGFVTDFQAPFAVLMAHATGQSTILETIFEGRLNYIEELNRMGAQMVLHNPHRVAITGPRALRGREIESPDLRAGLAFVIAALSAAGTSKIKNIYQIDRGYERIDERLRALGARIERV